MPRDAAPDTPAARAARLNARFRGASAPQVLSHALHAPGIGRVAMVSSFGAESAVLLHLISIMAPDTPVLFIDTEMLFEETLAYHRLLAHRFGLRDIRVIRPDRAALFAEDGDALLHRRDPGACCALRKGRPLAAALQGFDAWITGRKRYQGGRRATLEHFEVADARLKINPLAHWRREDMRAHAAAHALPPHPLVRHGYRSVGCAPCTGRVAPGEDDRAGRWRGRAKTECGIHFEGGRALRENGQ